MKTYILILLTLSALLTSCLKGYKIAVKNVIPASDNSAPLTGNRYLVVRSDSFHIPGASTTAPMYHPSARESMTYAQLEPQIAPVEGFITLASNVDSAYRLPLLKHNDLIYEFSLGNIYNYPKRLDARATLAAFPPWIIGLIITPIYMQKADPYLTGYLRVYTANGELAATYQNYQAFSFKMRGSSCCFVAREFLQLGFGPLKDKLLSQLMADTAVLAFLQAKEKLLAVQTIAAINEAFYKNYYSPVLLQLEHHARASLEEMKQGLVKEFRRNTAQDEEEFMPIAFSKYSTLKYNRVLAEMGQAEAAAGLEQDAANYNSFVEKYESSKATIVANRERMRRMAGTVLASIQQAGTVRNPNGVTGYLATVTSALQQNIAINYPHLKLNPYSPSIALPASQAATNNITGGDCSDAAQASCSNQADNDPQYRQWKAKLDTEPGEYYAMKAAIARSEATLKYCAACLSPQQQESIRKLMAECHERLALMASDKYISPIRPQYVRSIHPPGYGITTAGNDQRSGNNKPKVASRAY